METASTLLDPTSADATQASSGFLTHRPALVRINTQFTPVYRNSNKTLIAGYYGIECVHNLHNSFDPAGPI